MICSKNDFYRWKNGDVYFDFYKNEFVERKIPQMPPVTEYEIINSYEADEFRIKWDELSEDKKQKWREAFIKRQEKEWNHFLDERNPSEKKEYYTYDEFDVSYEEEGITPKGEEIVVFG